MNARRAAAWGLLVGAMLLGPALVVAKSLLDPDGDDHPAIGPRLAASVALISMDGIAASDLRLHDPTRPPSPAVEELARLGIVVDHAFGATDTCPAAAVSLITGQLPSTHGVRTFGAELDPAPRTLPTVLGAEGFVRGAFASEPLLSRTGLGAAFDVVEELPDVDAATLAARAGRFLEEHGGGEHLLWVHHHPDATIDTPEERAAEFDRLVGGVLGAMRQARTLEGTFVAAVGTYGRRHGDVEVPLVFRIPSRAAAGSRRTGPASVLDVAPTMLGVFGLQGMVRGPGRALASGDFKPLYTGFHFSDFALIERVGRDGRGVQVFRTAQYGLRHGPGAGELRVFDLKADPGMERDLVGGELGNRVRDFLWPRLVERRSSVPEAWKTRGP